METSLVDKSKLSEQELKLLDDLLAKISEGIIDYNSFLKDVEIFRKMPLIIKPINFSLYGCSSDLARNGLYFTIT